MNQSRITRQSLPILIAFALLIRTDCFAAPATLQAIPRSAPEITYGIEDASADGRVFVGSYAGVAFRWSTWAGYEILDDHLGASITSTSGDGSIVVGFVSEYESMNSHAYYGFVWRRNEGARFLSFSGPPPYYPEGTLLYGVSDDGSVLGGYKRINDDPTESRLLPFRRIETSNFYPSIPSNTYGRVRTMSGDGHVLVGEIGDLLSPTAAAWWSDGTYRNLGYLPGHTRSSARITNFDGSVIVGNSSSGGANQTFRWTLSEGMTTFTPLVSGASISCLSGDGTLAGGYSNNGSGNVATLWTSPSTPVEVGPLLASLGADTAGWTFFQVKAMSATGTILFGLGTLNGVTVNWRADLNGDCPSDFNEDFQIDDADFALFASSYNTLVCSEPAMPEGCPSDLNHDQFVDDADFVLFVAAYDDLVCP